jgi:hypothetical protein
MWVSEKYKIQWWLPPRTASRMTASFLQKLNFHQEWGHHTLFGESRYDVYLNIRNPYSLSTSYYFLTHKLHKLTFEEFIKKSKGNYEWVTNSHLLDYVKAFGVRKLSPAKIIRYENFEEDLMSVECIKSNQEILSEQITKLKQSTTPWRTDYKPEFLKPYSEFYTQELADIVYENRKKYFEFGGYDRDSWKTLIN